MSVVEEFSQSKNRFHKDNVKEMKIKVKKDSIDFSFSGEFNVSKFCSTEEIRNCILPTIGKGIFLNFVEGVVFRLQRLFNCYYPVMPSLLLLYFPKCS